MRKKGFTLVEVMTVVAVIGILAGAIVFANHVRQINTAREKVCLENRRLLEQSEQLYVMTEGAHSASMNDLVDKGYIRAFPECPSGGVYAWAPGTEGAPDYQFVAVCSVHGAFHEEEGTPTSLGSTFKDITGAMIDLIRDYYAKNGRYPRSSGDRAFTDIGLDPEEWKGGYEGVIYTPEGKQVTAAPADGYRLTVTDYRGNELVLTPDSKKPLLYDIQKGSWYYNNVNEKNRVDIGTLRVEEDL